MGYFDCGSQRHNASQQASGVRSILYTYTRGRLGGLSVIGLLGNNGPHEAQDSGHADPGQRILKPTTTVLVVRHAASKT